MTLTLLEEKFLNIFKASKTARNSIVIRQVIMGQVNKWPAEERDHESEVYNALANKEYVSFENNKYKLLDKGFDYLYKDHSIEQTKGLILDLIQKNNLQAGHVLFYGILTAARVEWDAYHQEKLPTAIAEMKGEGLIQDDRLGYRLLK